MMFLSEPKIIFSRKLNSSPKLSRASREAHNELRYLEFSNFNICFLWQFVLFFFLPPKPFLIFTAFSILSVSKSFAAEIVGFISCLLSGTENIKQKREKYIFTAERTQNTPSPHYFLTLKIVGRRDI